MKRKSLASLLILLSMSLLLANESVRAIAVPNPNQITFAAATGTLATTVDPHWASMGDYKSQELIQNIYEPLCMFDGLSASMFVAAVADSWPGYGTSGNVMVPSSPDATAPPGTVETWYFHIRTGNPWQDATYGYVTPADVEYSFERGMLMDHSGQTGDPMSILYGPLLGKTSSYNYDYNNNLDIDNNAEWQDLYAAVTGAIGSDATQVWFNLMAPLSTPTQFQQILCGTWSSVMCKQWCIAQGLWDGTNNYATWHATWNPPGPGPLMNPAKAMGSAPYRLTWFDSVMSYWRIDRHLGYWSGWPAPGANGYVNTVTTQEVAPWSNALAMFLSNNPSSQADFVDVPIGNEQDLHAGVNINNPLLPGVRYVPFPAQLGMARHYERTWINGWVGTVNENPKLPGNYYYTMWKDTEYTPVEVGERKEGGKTFNITDILVIGPWWPPKPGNPWFKVWGGQTYPTVNVNATIGRNDTEPVSVSVYISLTGSTAKGTLVEFGGGSFIMNAGDVLNFTGNISNFEVQPGNYSFWIICNVLGDYVNVHPSAAYYLGYAQILGYCDLNGDYVVAVKDFQLVKNAIPSTPGSAKWNWPADVNCDNVINVMDYVLLKGKVPTIYTPA